MSDLELEPRRRDDAMGDPYAEKLLAAALRYAAFGWKVFPCWWPVKGPGGGGYVCACPKGAACPNTGKHPIFHKRLIPNGHQNATDDPETIRGWWDKWPRANIGVVAGEVSDLVIFDFDERHDGGDTLRDMEQRHGPLPSGAVVKTGGGMHIYMRHPGFKVPSGHKVMGDGHDVRADGGYAIAPPSFHRTGREYMWLHEPKDGAAIEPLPAWAVQWFQEAAQRKLQEAEERRAHHVSTAGGRRAADFSPDEKRARCQRYVDTKPGVSEGGRNETAAKQVCPIGLDFDLDEDEFWPILVSWNNRNSPPLDEWELRRCLQSANKFRNNPRGCKLEEDSDEWVQQRDAWKRARQEEEEALWRASMEEAEVKAQMGQRTRVEPVAEPPSRPAPASGRNGSGSGGGRGGDGDGDGDSDREPEPEPDPYKGPGHGNRLRDQALTDLKSTDSLNGPDGIPRTDLGNAQRVIRDFGGDIRYVHHTKRWYLWTGAKWTQDARGMIDSMVAKTMRSMHRLMPAAAQQGEDEAKAWRSWIKTSEGRRSIINAIEGAGTFPSISLMPEDFDQHDFLVNTPAGYVDVRDLSHHKPDRRLLMSKCSKVSYLPESDCPTWKRFLNQIFGGDLELVEFFQRAAGYSLTGSTREQCLFFCHGTGSNGKSTAITAMQEVANDYARAADFDTFLEKRGDQSASNDLARLQGARLVAATEPDRNKRLNEATIKRITGQDVITARFLYSEFFDFKFRAKIWLSANHKPEIAGADHGIWRRIRLIPFEVQIADEDKDPDLPDKLRKEYPGIMAWMIEGAHEWNKHGLGVPEAVRKATESYRTEMDRLAEFFRRHCVQDPNAHAQSSKVYGVYRAWAIDSGLKPLSHRKFTQALGERGIPTKSTKKYNVYMGIGLLDPGERPDQGDPDEDDFRGPTQRSFDDT